MTPTARLIERLRESALRETDGRTLPRMDKLLNEAADALAASEADAARYRWLREQKYVDIAACWLVASDVTVPEDFDAAIDAALTNPPRVAKGEGS